MSSRNINDFFKPKSHTTDCQNEQQSAMSKISEVTSSELDLTFSEPNHPSDLTMIPPQQTNNRTLRFQKSWFVKYPWLHWNCRSVVCFYCADISPKNAKENAFISQGFCNWKKALEKFQEHERSNVHRDCAAKHKLKGSAGKLLASMSESLKEDQKIARSALFSIFSTIRYLARQGLAMRGNNDANGNLIQLLQLRSIDNKDLQKWMKRYELETDQNKCRHLLSHDVQNEILRDMCHSVLRALINDIKKSHSFVVMCDGTQDISGLEQESLCIRYVCDELLPHEVFLGLYETSETTGASIVKIIEDMMARFDLPISKLRGQVYDGASNMSGAYSGAQRFIMDKQPLAYYLHCPAHCVNLVAGKVADIPFIRDAMGCANELGNIFSSTIKFRNIIKTLTANSPNAIRPLCPTRWTVRFSALETILESYEEIIKALEEFSNLATISREQKSKSAGLLKTFLSGETYIAFNLSSQLFGALESLVKASSLRNSTLADLLEAKEVTCATLQTQRDNFKGTFSKCQEEITKLGLHHLKQQRARKVPKRFDSFRLLIIQYATQ